MKPKIGHGDKGRTSIIGCNLSKTSPLVSLIGSLDELNSFIGFSRSLLYSNEDSRFRDLDGIMKEIQTHIFLISSELVGAKLKSRITKKEVEWIENVIDKLEKEIKPITCFVYPSGSVPASSLQVARAVCRRVERKAFKFSKRERIIRSEILAYLNRLSDLLFTLARVVNNRLNFDEEFWKSEN